MFVNCPNCNALVATDLATDLPPERCPRCSFAMRADKPAATHATAVPAPEPAPTQPAAPTPGTLVFVPLKPSRPAAAIPPSAETTARQDEPPAAVEAAVPPAPPAQPAPAPAPVQSQAPGFLRRSRGITRPGRRSIALAGGLAVLLVVQLLLADRERLAASAGWRPTIAVLCGALRCSLPSWRDPAAIAVEQRDVRPLPDRPGVLRVSATIRNDASWAQAWPRLTLTLSDVDGRALGMRAFEPAEYLTTPPQDVTVASGESAAIQMDIVEPSPHAIAFNFQFD